MCAPGRLAGTVVMAVEPMMHHQAQLQDRGVEGERDNRGGGKESSGLGLI